MKHNIGYHIGLYYAIFISQKYRISSEIISVLYILFLFRLASASGFALVSVGWPVCYSRP